MATAAAAAGLSAIAMKQFRGKGPVPAAQQKKSVVVKPPKVRRK